MNTILIKNALLLDGSGKPAEKNDILIRGDKISAIDSLINYKVSETIDAMGAYVSPGFIDVANYSDRYLDIFFNPLQERFLKQGITTIIGGHNGFSLAPLIYGSLQAVRQWADVSKINVDWHTFSEFFKLMKKKSLGVNFGTLLGHTTIRRAIVGEPFFRDLTEEESAVLISTLKKNLQSGAFGISIGLDNSLVAEASYFEIKKIAEIAAKLGRILSINLKDNKAGLIESVKKIIFLSKETGAKILITNLFPFNGFENHFQSALNLIKENSGIAHISFIIYPFGENSMLVRDFLPSWLKGIKREEVLEIIGSQESKNKVLDEMSPIGEDAIIINAPGNEHLVGLPLQEFSQNRGISLKEGLLELMQITKLRAEILLKNVNIEKFSEIISSENVLFSSGAIAPSFSQNAFTKILGITEMPVEIAIRKITALPAQILGLEKRGEIKNGYFADLVIFKDTEIKEVIVNGKRVIKDGQLQNIFSGTILKHVSI